ncbi:MAG TPA: DPP IV N-terminal domain-containing protein [Phenylobacterium sp.]|uniref:S9 family peptidase n=1 Tax=Phenylobacterium sp. TaxID=1871053 RepID=UPI002D2ADE7C|nr:DPP IV N-terminal domain-containing protein [Phenylobacterium sp.]HZZ69772.1 DPP IV N-terminal domain-containing protein [Phenylobacterium sp.]
MSGETMKTLDGEARYRALLGDPNLVKGGRIEPVWVEGGAGLAFVERSGASPVLTLVEAASGQVRWRVDAAELGDAMSPVSLTSTPDGGLLAVVGQRRLRLDLASGAAQDLTAEETAALARLTPGVTRLGYPTVFPPEMELVSPDGAWFLTIKDHDVWLRPMGEGEARRITDDGVADPRLSTERAAWSPDGRFVALMRIDERAVHRVPIVDWMADVAAVTWATYPRADGPIPVWEVHLVDVANGTMTRIGGGDEGHYSFILGFSADSQRLRYARLERRAKYVEILEHDIATGAGRTLLEETAESFLCWTPVFIREGPPIRFLTDGRFLWQSERSGWNQIYLHDADGGLVRALTEGAYPVTGIAGIDEAAGTVLYRAQPDAARPYDAQIFRTSFANGSRVQLSSGPGVHEAYPAPDLSAYVEVRSAPDRPPEAELHTADGRLIAKLSQADASGLKALGWRAPEEFVAKAADGATDLHGLIYVPADFDPRRKYPILEHIYAGGQTIQTPHAFGPGLCSALAQLGFVLVVLDARGTPGRGKAFQDVVTALGDYEIADHAGAIRQVAASRPWMDLTRVGVFGLSYGGYFTIRALIQAGDLYRSGVALAPAELGPAIMSAPVESYIGLPADNPQRYQAIRNSDKLAGLTGDLLIIAGTDDVNTPIAQTMAYAKGLAAAGKAFDQIVIPGLNHLLMDAAGRSDALFAYAAMMRHFRRTLSPEGTPS